MIDREWAADYASRLQVKYSTTFPMIIGRKKIGGYIDATAHCKDEEQFFEAYSQFNDHPRCAAIMLYTDNGTVSI